MYNLMIIGKPTHQLIKLVNKICKEVQNVRVYCILSNIDEALNMLHSYKVDIILLNLDSLKNMDLILIKYIQTRNLYRYNKSIIIKLDEKIIPDTTNNSNYVFSYTYKTDEVISSIRELISTKTNLLCLDNITNEIKQQLIYLGYNYSYNGTKYLEETIIDIYKIRFDFDGNISKNIYPNIAKKYKKKIDTIYGNIKQATNIMITNCNKSKIIDYFNYSYYTKPKVQEIIFTVLNKIA